MRYLMTQPRFIMDWLLGRKQTTCRPINGPNEYTPDALAYWASREFAASRARLPTGCLVSIRRWTGKPYRSKQEDICTRKLEGRWIVTIRRDAPDQAGDIDVVATVMPGGAVQLDEHELQHFAWHEGFKDIYELRDWFAQNYPNKLEWHGMCYRFACPPEVEF